MAASVPLQEEGGLLVSLLMESAVFFWGQVTVKSFLAFKCMDLVHGTVRGETELRILTSFKPSVSFSIASVGRFPHVL